MPQISKQAAASAKTTSSQNGTMLSRAIPVSDLEDDFIKIVLYGMNRVGKTHLACQFPKPLLLIAFEPHKSGGATTVKKVQGVTYIKITSSIDALKLAEELKTDTTFKTHVIDSATSYQDVILQELLGLSAVPVQLDWGLVSLDQYRARSEKTREALRPFLNLLAHTVVCAKERDHNPPSEMKPKIVKGEQLESFFAADLGGATVGWLHDACDYIGRLYVTKEVLTRKITTKFAGKEQETEQSYETGKIVRRLRTLYHPNFAAGFRSCTPELVPEYINSPSYEKIRKVIAGEKLAEGDAKYA